jgi:CDGSH-type Zn-finger protein
MSTTPRTTPPRVEVRHCPGGPLLVRGAHEVLDEDGAAHPVERPVVAVCACGKSQRKPWCDGTHKVLPGYRR